MNILLVSVSVSGFGDGSQVIADNKTLLINSGRVTTLLPRCTFAQPKLLLGGLMNDGIFFCVPLFWFELSDLKLRGFSLSLTYTISTCRSLLSILNI